MGRYRGVPLPALSEPVPIADWSRLAAEPDLPVPLPGGGAMLFRRIPAGSFLMGARGAGTDEEPRHRVVLPRDFHLGKFVVTQAEWRAVAALSAELSRAPGLDPSDSVNTGDRRPVTDVSWDDATAWCAVWSKQPGLPAGLIARLPTEAEWEYACRAGSETDFYSGDGEAALAEVAWFGEDWKRGAHLVEERIERHPAGLHGMHGNVWEWCRDAYYGDAYRRRIDGEIASEGELRPGDAHDSQLRALRGGAWLTHAPYCRSAFRDGDLPGGRVGGLGFRVCLAPGPTERKAEAEQAEAAGGRERRRPARLESSATDAAGAARNDVDLSRHALPAYPGENVTPDDTPSRALFSRDETRESPLRADIRLACGVEKARGGAVSPSA